MPKSKNNRPTRSRGRPRTHTMPDPIPDTPENVARILMTTPPPNESEWQYIRDTPPTSTYNRKIG